MVKIGELATTQELDAKYLRHENLPSIWCPGCGIGTISGAMVRAIDLLGLKQDQVVVATGIGCSGLIYNYLKFDGYHGTHGRALPAATGIKAARPELTVVVPMGDGDCLAIGGNHFIQAARRNIDVTAIIVNNEIYGMTGGQYSPTTPSGSRAATAPLGHLERPFDACDLARGAGATFVSRGTTYHAAELVELIAAAVTHRGFSVVEVMSQCPVRFGKMNGVPEAAEMLRDLKRRAVPVSRLGKAPLPPGQFATGVLHRDEAPEWTQQYGDLSARAAERARARHAAAPSETSHPTPPAPRIEGRLEVILAGSAGQGLAFAGVVLAEVAVHRLGLNVSQSETHGAAVRSGQSRSEVVISPDEIDHPIVEAADLLLALTPETAREHAPRLKPGGLLLIEESAAGAVQPEAARVVALPLVEAARAFPGGGVMVNVLSLGALVELTPVLAAEAVEAVLLDHARDDSGASFLEAFRKGRELAREATRGR